MLIYTIDYDNLIIIETEIGDFYNQTGFDREMDESFGEGQWYTDIIEAEETINNHKRGEE